MSQKQMSSPPLGMQTDDQDTPRRPTQRLPLRAGLPRRSNEDLNSTVAAIVGEHGSLARVNPSALRRRLVGRSLTRSAAVAAEIARRIDR